MMCLGAQESHRPLPQQRVEVISLGHTCYNSRPVAGQRTEDRGQRTEDRGQTPLPDQPLFYGRRFAMSTTTPTQAALLQATRQQLDELDAMLERMLALPVVELPEEEAAAETE